MPEVRAAVALVVLLVLTGCGSAGDGSLTGAGATPLPTGPASSPGPSPTSSPGPPPTSSSGPSVAAAPLVVFSRTGGLAGRAVTLTVQPDGAAQVFGRREVSWTLTPGQLDGLRRALEDADLRPVPPTGAPVLDGFSYRITYAGRSVLLRGNPVPGGAATVLARLSALAEGP